MTVLEKKVPHSLEDLPDGELVGDDETEISADKEWSTADRYKWMLALFLGQAVLYMARAILPVCAVYIGREFHWDKTTMGALLGCFFWGYTLTQFIGGYMADQIGGEIVLAFSAVLWGSMTILFPVMPHIFTAPTYTLAMLISVRVFAGLFQGFHNPSVGSLLAQRVGRNQRGFAYCVHSSGAHMGVLLAGAAGSLMLSRYTWRVPFLVIGVLGIAWGLVVKVSIVPDAPSKETAAAAPVKPPIEWRSLFFSISFWSLLVGHYAHASAYFIILSWAPTYFHDQFPEATSWVFNVVPWLVAFPSSLATGLFSDWLLRQRYDLTLVRKFMETLSLLGTAFFLILLTFTNNYTTSLMCIGLAIAFGGCHQAGICLNVLDVAPNCGGAVFGIINMAGSLPGFIGVYLAGFILEKMHSWAAVFQHTAAICIVGWLIYIQYGTTKRIL